MRKGARVVQFAKNQVRWLELHLPTAVGMQRGLGLQRTEWFPIGWGLDGPNGSMDISHHWWNRGGSSR